MKNIEILSKIRALFEEVGDMVELEDGEYTQPNGDVWVVKDKVIVEIRKAEETAETTTETTTEEVAAEEEAPAAEPAPAEEPAAPAEDERIAQLEQLVAELTQRVNSAEEALRALKEDGEEFKTNFKRMEKTPSAQPAAFSATAEQDPIAAKIASLKRFKK